MDYPESEGDEEEDDGTTDGRRGSAKRQRYDTLTKHAVLSRYNELLAAAIENDEETGKGTGWLTAAYVQLQEEFGEIPVSNLSKWTQIDAVRNKTLEEMAKPGKKKKESNGSGRKPSWPGMEKLLALAVRKRRDKGLKVSVSVDSLKAFYSELCSVPAHPALLTMLNCNYSVGCLSAAATMDAHSHCLYLR